MTEREIMTAGGFFNTNDPNLQNDKKNARIWATKYNNSSENDPKLRLELLKSFLGKCGEKIFIKPTFRCDFGYNIFIGENFFANFDCILLDAAPIIIGDNCMFGPRVSIYAVSHPLDPVERGNSIVFSKKVVLGNNVWVGGGSIILPGVELGDNVVVGAGSIVTKSFPSNVVIAGNPAHIIKKIEKESNQCNIKL